MSEQKAEYHTGTDEAQEANILVAMIQQALDKHPVLDRVDTDIAITLIKNYVKIQTRHKFACSGTCINCDTGIQYGELSRSQMKYGDAWLLSLRNRWKTPPTIQDRGRKGLVINGFAEKTVMPYLCYKCQQEIMAALEEQKEEDKQLLQERRQQMQVINGDIIIGKIKTSPSKRFHVMTSTFYQHNSIELKNMPYKQFLQTHYWTIVRNYKLYLVGYKCNLCGSSSILNVHHKSYEHHGEEHKYLEDLIVLCQPCHGKFHDKLEASNE